MTAPSSIDPTRFLHEQLDQASPDLLRQMLTTFINTLMSAEADAVCGAAYSERTDDRTNVRNGYRHTSATRRAMRAFHAMMAWDTRDVDRRMAAAVNRLVELGIPAAEADAFDGELGE